MGKISAKINVCGDMLDSISFNEKTCTPLSAEVFKCLNKTNLTPKDLFIHAMENERRDLILYRDEKNDFVAYTKSGSVYCCFHDDYYVMFYPKPSLIPTKIINHYLHECNEGRDYKYMAELYRFLSLTDEEKDKEGFAFYGWIWEDGLWDNMAKSYHFSSTDHCNQKSTAKVKTCQCNTSSTIKGTLIDFM